MTNPDQFTDRIEPLYVFLDEGGNLDFSGSGSRFFTITSLATRRPFAFEVPLTDLRFDLIESGLDIEYFHASEDRQAIRDKVIEALLPHLDEFRVDSIIVEKRKTAPTLRSDNAFYPRMLGYLIRYLINGVGLVKISEVIVITDRLPVNKKRRAVEKAVKTTLHAMLPVEVKFRVMHHCSRSCCGLQVVDYFNWAIYRRWEKGDARSYSMLSKGIQSTFDIFRQGTTMWY